MNFCNCLHKVNLSDIDNTGDAEEYKRESETVNICQCSFRAVSLVVLAAYGQSMVSAIV